MKRLVTLSLTALIAIQPLAASAEKLHACFLGQDASNQPARMSITAERIGNYYEIYGQVATTGFGLFRVKADGWSGNGRMFRNHEGEAGAVFIQFTDFTGDAVMFHVDGFGAFPFRRTAC